MMQIPTNKWHYYLWSTTFDISYALEGMAQPEHTTQKRYWLRIFQMLFPVFLSLLISFLLVLIGTIFGNILTIFSGNGVWVTWEPPGWHLRRFHSQRIVHITLKTWFVNINKVLWLDIRILATFLWVTALLTMGWYFWPHPAIFQQIEEMTIGDAIKNLSPLWTLLSWVGAVVIAGVVAFLIVVYSDNSERVCQEYIRQIMSEAEETDSPTPDEIITFVDPNQDWHIT